MRTRVLHCRLSISLNQHCPRTLRRTVDRRKMPCLVEKMFTRVNIFDAPINSRCLSIFSNDAGIPVCEEVISQ